MHLEVEQLERLLHGELAAAADAHLAACAECTARLEVARRDEADVFGLLRALDHPVPAVSAAAIAARGRALRWARRAAGVVLALGIAGAAYAAPGSPLREWVARVAAWVGGARQAPEEGRAGIAVVPGDSFVIAFTTAQTRGQVLVTLEARSDVAVRRLGGAATFASDVDRLTIANADATADYEIVLPLAAPRVELWVAARRVFLKDGDRVISDAPAGGRGYVVPLTPP